MKNINMISDHQPVATVTTISFWLVVSTHLKNISQLGLFPTEWKNKKCSKPPTRIGFNGI